MNPQSAHSKGHEKPLSHHPVTQPKQDSRGTMATKHSGLSVGERAGPVWTERLQHTCVRRICLQLRESLLLFLQCSCRISTMAHCGGETKLRRTALWKRTHHTKPFIRSQHSHSPTERANLQSVDWWAWDKTVATTTVKLKSAEYKWSRTHTHSTNPLFTCIVHIQ